MSSGGGEIGVMRQLATLNRIARIAIQDLALRPMLQRIVDILHEEFGWEFVACASIDLLLSRDWAGEVAAISAGLEAGLAPARGLPGVADVRVLGAIGVIETTAPIDVAAVQRTLLDHGVWLRPFRNLLYTMPPYVIGPADLALVTSAMVAAARGLG